MYYVRTLDEYCDAWDEFGGRYQQVDRVAPSPWTSNGLPVVWVTVNGVMRPVPTNYLIELVELQLTM